VQRSMAQDQNIQPAAGFTHRDLALSTCWASEGAQSADWLLERLAATGLSSLELEYRLATPVLNQLRPELRPRGFSVTSVHNYCPLPPEFPPEKASGDLFNLAAGDKEERLLAVSHTMRSLELASDLEAKAVILHLGWVEGIKDLEVTKEAARQKELTPKLAAHLKARREKAPRSLDAVSFSLDRLLPRAQSLGVCLGLENRFHACQVPDIGECALLLERFAGAPVGPWFDVGHAHVQGLAGLASVEDWLARFGERLLGCHLQDAIGIGDHLPPGAGGLDWTELSKALWAVPIKVMEIHPGPGPEEIKQAAGMLAGLFSQAARQAGQKQEGGPA